MQKNREKIIFFGTADFAVPTLEALVKEGYTVVAIITTPDRLAGRKQILTPPPVKVAAQKLGLKIFQPEKLRDNPDLVEKLKNLNPGIGILAAYGKLIPSEIFNLPRYGILVLHPSLLPKYRGPSPVQTAILNGDKETGITIIKMDEEMDHGDIISSASYRISDNASFKEINDGIWHLGSNLLIKTLPDYLTGKIKPHPQDHSKATSCKLIKSSDGELKTDNTVELTYNKIRALNPDPGTYFEIEQNNKKLRLKIIETQPPNYLVAQPLSKGLFVKDGSLALGLQNGYLILKTVQPEGKKPMSGKDFVRGYF